MPRPQRPWFRVYVEVIHDRKLRRRPPSDRWLWVVLMAIARQSPVSGYLLISESSPVTMDDLVDFAALPEKQIVAGMEYFEQAGMLARDRNVDCLFLTRWTERQYESDDVTKRTRQSRSREHRRNVPTSFLGTPPETEADTETENPLTPLAIAKGGRRANGKNPRAVVMQAEYRDKRRRDLAAFGAHAARMPWDESIVTDQAERVFAEPDDRVTAVDLWRTARQRLEGAESADA